MKESKQKTIFLNEGRKTPELKSELCLFKIGFGLQNLQLHLTFERNIPQRTKMCRKRWSDDSELHSVSVNVI